MSTLDIDKMLAAVAYICNTNGGKFDKLALIKAMYIAERECICETFNHMTGDEMLGYKFGPVLKNLLDATRGKAFPKFQQKWDYYFAKSDHSDDIKMLKTPDLDELSHADKLFLDRAIKFVNDCPKGTLVEKVHEFPEWDIAIKRGIHKIDVADILSKYRSDLTTSEVIEIKKELETA